METTGAISIPIHFKQRPFGMLNAGRNWESGTGYRYGFNGKENEDEIAGNNNDLDFGERVYDARLGRWFSVDANGINNIYNSPFSYVKNNPINKIDPDGKTDFDVRYIVEKDDQNAVIKVTAYVTIVYQVLDLSSSQLPVDDAYDLTGPLPTYNVNFDLNGVEVDVKIDIKYDFITSVDQVKDTKNVLMVVDQLTNSNDEGTVGQADMNNQAMIIPYSSRHKLGVILHEMGHNLEFLFKNGAAHSDDPNHLMYSEENGSTKTNPKDFIPIFGFLASKKESGSEHVTDVKDGSNAKETARRLFKSSAFKFNSKKAKDAGITP